MSAAGLIRTDTMYAQQQRQPLDGGSDVMRSGSTETPRCLDTAPEHTVNALSEPLPSRLRKVSGWLATRSVSKAGPRL